MATGASAKLAIGPVLFNWTAEAWRDFHFRIADEAPVDSVVLGEAVCAKRLPFLAPEIPGVVDRLRAAGKEVVLTTLALVMDERDLEAVRAVTAEAGLLVEANDMAAVSLLAGRAFAVGPYVNVYNEGTLALLAGLGAVRVCLPPELGGRVIAALGQAARVGHGPELEVQVFGRAALALSARCYHARSRALAKDGCQYVCADDADGMEVATLDGEPFLAVNGIQTLSHAWVNLAREVPEMRAAGVTRFRLSPQTVDMAAAAGVFRDLLDGRVGGEEAAQALAAIAPGAVFANGFYHAVEGERLVATTPSSARPIGHATGQPTA